MHSHDHDHDHAHTFAADEEGSPVVAKAVAMCVLFSASFIIGCIPIKLATLLNWDGNPKNKTVVQMLLNFGGGVLLCTTFLHLLPEVAENIESLQAQGHLPDMKMHFAEFLMCVGFFTMYLVEELVHFYMHHRQNSHDKFKQNLSIRRKEPVTVSTAELVKDVDEGPKQFDHQHQHHHQDSHVGHSHLIIEDSVVTSLRGLLVVLALSVHELFEGLAVGLESSASNVWYMFGAVSAHKLVIAFCIGVELVSTKTKKALIFIYVFLFAVVSPMGIGIGIFVSDSDNSATDTASVILQGLASGTLLYVVFFEILQREHRGGLKVYFSVVAGFALMFGMTFIGIGTGIILSGTGTSEIDVTSVVLQGMAAGTLLYVVFFEVLARERNNSHAGIWQLLAIIAGFAIMFAMQMLTGHDHSHGEEHGVPQHSHTIPPSNQTDANLF